MSETLHAAAAAPAALSAFLRGVERRAAVLADLQCGESATAERALAAAMRAFRNHAAALPMAEWPQRFWTLLATTPGLRQPAAGAAWPMGMEALVALDPAHRLGLLLRLAAGLDEEPAAAAAGLDQAAYREALAVACPRDARGEPDPVAWRALAEAIQQQVRTLPPERLAALARLRESAIEGSRVPSVAARDSRVPPPPHLDSQSTPRPPDWRRRALAAVVLLLGLALLAVWYWSGPGDGGDAAAPSGDPQVVVEALPESPPAARYTDAQALILHPDLELLLDPEEPTLVQDADFLAWYLAAMEVQPEAIDEPSGDVDVSTAGGLADARR